MRNGIKYVSLPWTITKIRNTATLRTAATAEYIRRKGYTICHEKMQKHQLKKPSLAVCKEKSKAENEWMYKVTVTDSTLMFTRIMNFTLKFSHCCFYFLKEMA